MLKKDSITLNKSICGSIYCNYSEVNVNTTFSESLITFRAKRSGLFLIPEKINVEVTGKVFKWLSKGKLWFFLVHYSHITNLVFHKLIFFFKKSGKNRYTLFSKKRVYFFSLKRFLHSIRYSDLFTNRGIKYTPRKFFKKQGKISTYV